MTAQVVQSPLLLPQIELSTPVYNTVTGLCHLDVSNIVSMKYFKQKLKLF